MTITYTTIRVNPADMEAIVSSLRDAPKALRQAYSTAINRTLAGMKTDALKSDGPIRSRHPILRKQIAPYIGIRKATIRNLHGSFKFNKSHRLKLSIFDPMSDPGGVTYMIDREKGRRLLPGGFTYPKNASGKKVKWVARRVGKRKKPLAFPKGLSPWGMFNKAGVWKVMKVSAERRYPVELKRAVAFRIQVINGHIKRRMRNGIIVKGGHDQAEPTTQLND